MGMAASQARLLTLTARLNHIEMESQGLTNSKIRLSDKTQQASDAYIKALNKTDLLYSNYNSQGDIVNQKLTGSALSYYGPLKNQYGIVNAAGQIMVSELDGKNFKESNNLQEFLGKYGLVKENTTSEFIKIENPLYKPAMNEYEDTYKKWQTEEPNPSDPIYKIIGGGTPQTELYDSFLYATSICYASAMSYLAGNLGLEGETILDRNGNKILTYDNDKSVTYDESGNILSEFSVKGKECYSHVFDHLLPLGRHYSSLYYLRLDTDASIDVDEPKHWWKNQSINDRYERSQVLTDLFRPKAEPVLYACGDTGKNITPGSSDIDLLMSDYYFEGGGEKKLKTLQQKIIDLNYACDSNLLSDQQLYDAIKHFVNEDLGVLGKGTDSYDTEKYKKDVKEWEEREPKKPDVPAEIDKEIITTTKEIVKKDEAQWYVNLWHRMNGESNFKAGFGSSEDYNPEDGYASISKTAQSWCVLKDGEMNSPEWLKFALENGVVTLEQVQFTDPSKEGTGVKNIQWTSMIWSSAQDISEQKNSTASTLAEVKYNNELKAIESKDKDFDNRLKKLDTEHKAIQTEYDSVKTVIQKNTERTFKLFS